MSSNVLKEVPFNPEDLIRPGSAETGDEVFNNAVIPIRTWSRGKTLHGNGFEDDSFDENAVKYGNFDLLNYFPDHEMDIAEDVVDIVGEDNEEEYQGETDAQADYNDDDFIFDDEEANTNIPAAIQPPQTASIEEDDLAFTPENDDQDAFAAAMNGIEENIPDLAIDYVVDDLNINVDETSNEYIEDFAIVQSELELAAKNLPEIAKVEQELFSIDMFDDLKNPKFGSPIKRPAPKFQQPALSPGIAVSNELLDIMNDYTQAISQVETKGLQYDSPLPIKYKTPQKEKTAIAITYEDEKMQQNTNSHGSKGTRSKKNMSESESEQESPPKIFFEEENEYTLAVKRQDAEKIKKMNQTKYKHVKTSGYGSEEREKKKQDKKWKEKLKSFDAGQKMKDHLADIASKRREKEEASVIENIKAEAFKKKLKETTVQNLEQKRLQQQQMQMIQQQEMQQLQQEQQQQQLRQRQAQLQKPPLPKHPSRSSSPVVDAKGNIKREFSAPTISSTIVDEAVELSRIPRRNTTSTKAVGSALSAIRNSRSSQLPDGSEDDENTEKAAPVSRIPIAVRTRRSKTPPPPEEVNNQSSELTTEYTEYLEAENQKQQDQQSRQMKTGQLNKKISDYLSTISNSRKQQDEEKAKQELRKKKRMEIIKQRIFQEMAERKSMDVEDRLATEVREELRQSGEEVMMESQTSSKLSRPPKSTKAKPQQQQQQETAETKPAPTVAAPSSSITAVTASSNIQPIYRDYNDWKRKNHITADTPVFCMTGWYPCVKQALLDRGWFFNPDSTSPYCDLKWTLRSTDICQNSLQPWQLTNHFQNNIAITTKVGLLHSLKSVTWLADISINEILPRGYDLSSPEELRAFVQDYQFQHVSMLMKHLYHKLTGLAQPRQIIDGNDSLTHPPSTEEQGQGGQEEEATTQEEFHSVQINRGIYDTCMSIIARRLTYYQQNLDEIPGYDERQNSISQLEWEIVTCYDLYKANQLTAEPTVAFIDRYLNPTPGEQPSNSVVAKKAARTHNERLKVNGDLGRVFTPARTDVEELSNVLASLHAAEEYQTTLNGNCETSNNMWIVKPAAKSRGRGINTFNDITKLFKYIDNNGLPESTKEGSGNPSSSAAKNPSGNAAKATLSNANQWIVQKYMENSMFIANRKFDLRQWVLVTDWNPLTVYFYDECYARFSVEEYNTNKDDLNNCYIHLVNNSIGKNHDKFDSMRVTTEYGYELEGFMLGFDDFRKHCRQHMVERDRKYVSPERQRYLDRLLQQRQQNASSSAVEEDREEKEEGSESVDRDTAATTAAAAEMDVSEEYDEYDIVKNKIQPKMKEIARSSLMCASEMVEHRKNSWELYGFDYMIDDEYNPWLIEINSSPACDYSTKITERYVQKALVEILSVVMDVKDWESQPKKTRGPPPSTGGWECIHKGQLLEKPLNSLGLDLSLKGEKCKLPPVMAAQIQSLKVERPPRVTNMDDSDGELEAEDGTAEQQETDSQPSSPVQRKANQRSVAPLKSTNSAKRLEHLDLRLTGNSSTSPSNQTTPGQLKPLGNPSQKTNRRGFAAATRNKIKTQQIELDDSDIDEEDEEELSQPSPAPVTNSNKKLTHQQQIGKAIPVKVFSVEF